MSRVSLDAIHTYLMTTNPYPDDIFSIYQPFFFIKKFNFKQIRVNSFCFVCNNMIQNIPLHAGRNIISINSAKNRLIIIGLIRIYAFIVPSD